MSRNLGGPFKYDWPSLKIEFMKGEWTSVSQFLRDKEIPVNLNNGDNTNGWAQEKKEIMRSVVKRATQEIVEEDVNDEIKVRERQARLARFMQLKGMNAMEKIEVKSADEARKLVQTGLIQERDALGINEGSKGGGANLTQVNVNLPKTKLDELLDGLDTEGILKLLAEIKRERVRRTGKADVDQSQTEPIGQGSG